MEVASRKPNEMRVKTPVALFIYNRPHVTERVFSVISKVKPSRLLIVADGPRFNVVEDHERCVAARSVVDHIDWDCQVERHYASGNLGCRKRVSSGLDWVFSKVDEAIIFEDDCLPDVAFFQFCDELLERYRNDSRVAHISGANIPLNSPWTKYSYYFSRNHYHIWGWATWRRAWQYYDLSMSFWPEVRDHNWLAYWLYDPSERTEYLRIFEDVYQEKIDTWAYQWLFACWIHQGLSIVPNANLVSNIGFDRYATHFKDENHYFANWPTTQMRFPLVHPNFFVISE
ncbi:MAG: glycosyltransferase family 2 protein [Desulfobacterales bacterium]|nr:glycosyltransferase family 2 protein [Desulfobacterales bacterium]